MSLENLIENHGYLAILLGTFLETVIGKLKHCETMTLGALTLVGWSSGAGSFITA